MLKVYQDLKIKLSAVSNKHINERSKDVNAFFTNFEDFAYCNNIEGLIGYLDASYASSDWCLFIDSSKSSLKASLMYK